MTGKWLVAVFTPVALFSQRMSVATSSGSKTLLVPTPYSFKVALVDAAFRAGGEVPARHLLSIIKGSDIRFRPPEHAVVTNTFVKIRRTPKTPTADVPFISSISFREFCYYCGNLEVGIGLEGIQYSERLEIENVLSHLNYLGKRGSFFQYISTWDAEELPPGFTVPVPNAATDLTGYAVIQYLDEMVGTDDDDLFERISTYSGRPIGNHRSLRPYLLPYRAVSTSKRYTHYVRVAGVGD